MNLLKIKNDYSWLISEDNELKTKLWSSLRFREKNYFHSRVYKKKLLDGYTEFLNKLSQVIGRNSFLKIPSQPQIKTTTKSCCFCV